MTRSHVIRHILLPRTNIRKVIRKLRVRNTGAFTKLTLLQIANIRLHIGTIYHALQRRASCNVSAGNAKDACYMFIAIIYLTNKKS